MDSMFSCYFLLNMKVILLYMVSATCPSLYKDDLIWKFGKNLWEQHFFLHFWQDKPLWWELKIYGGVTFITTLSLIQFFRNSQHPEKWNVSFKNFFRKCECISCDLLISSNLLKKSFRKSLLFVPSVTGVTEKNILLAEYFKLLL